MKNDDNRISSTVIYKQRKKRARDDKYISNRNEISEGNFLWIFFCTRHIDDSGWLISKWYNELKRTYLFILSITIILVNEWAWVCKRAAHTHTRARKRNDSSVVFLWNKILFTSFAYAVLLTEDLSMVCLYNNNNIISIDNGEQINERKKYRNKSQ